MKKGWVSKVFASYTFRSVSQAFYDILNSFSGLQEVPEALEGVPGGMTEKCYDRLNARRRFPIVIPI